MRIYTERIEECILVRILRKFYVYNDAMITITSYVASSPNAILEQQTYNAPQLLAHQILIDVDYCGICHSDLRFIGNEFGDSRYPLVAGHEIIGTVRELGTTVTEFIIGDKVAIAWQQGSCGTCNYCQTEHEEVCAKLEAICLTHHGGFADQMIVNASFAHKLPASLITAGAAAAPLLCAGTTIFNAILACAIKPGMRIGVVGMGGLGHLAIKFLQAMRCDVVVFSSSENKKPDALKFGATDFVSSIDGQAINNLNNSCDAIIYTPDVNLDYEAFFNVLKPFGIFCFTGIPMEAPTIRIFPLVIGEKSIKAVTCGNRKTIKKMLDFAAEHSIVAEVETVSMLDINDALKKVAENQLRYRLVLANNRLLSQPKVTSQGRRKNE